MPRVPGCSRFPFPQTQGLLRSFGWQGYGCCYGYGGFIFTMDEAPSPLSLRQRQSTLDVDACERLALMRVNVSFNALKTLDSNAKRFQRAGLNLFNKQAFPGLGGR